MAALRASLPVTNKKHHTFSSTIPTILGIVIDEVRTIIVPLRSVVSPLGAIENLWENAPTEDKCL